MGFNSIMIGVIIKTFWFYLLANVLVILRKPIILSELYYAGLSNKKPTFRFPDKSKRDVLMTIRIYKRLLLNLLKKKQPIVFLNTKSSSYIFDGTVYSIDTRNTYITNLTGSVSGGFISKDNLIYRINFWLTVFFILCLSITFFPVFLLSLFHNKKYHLALLLQEFIEVIQLQYLLKKNRITHLHYFCIYEREANLWSYILMKSNIYINKIPSEVPLHFWNKIIISNELSTCFSYQKQEVEYYKQTMFVNKITNWVPETFFEAPERFLEKRELNNPPEFQIGFFSSGNWLRTYINDLDLGYNDKENEELLFKTLINYANENNIKLKVFLHPLEKKEQYNQVVFDYYKNFIDDKIIFLADKNIKSIEGFDTIEMGVALYSTLMFERLTLGFKTIIAPWDYVGFPIPNSSFANVCSKSSDDIVELIDKNINLSTNDFFVQNQITDLVYQNTLFNN